GHRAAAGITIDAAKLPAFAERFNAVARARLTREDLVPELRVDLELPIDEASDDLESLLRHFEPFGVGNPAPVLVSRGVRLAGRPRLVGSDGLKLALDCVRGPNEAIGWSLASRAASLEGAHAVDIAYRLERDEY